MIVVVLLCVTMPTKYSGAETSKDEEESIVEEVRSVLEEELENFDSGLDCNRLMELAKDIVDTRPTTEWEPALNFLVTCALQEPSNAAPRWNLAVILLEMDHVDESLEFMDHALTLDQSNLEYLKSGGMFLSRIGLHSKVISCLEHYLEVALRVPSWEQLLASISVQREDEWMFLYDAGDDVVEILEILQTAYLHEFSLIKAGYLYKIIIGLKGDEVNMSLLISYSFFAFNLGDLLTGIKYLRLFTERQYVMKGYGDLVQAYEVVTAHSLRLFTAGFDSQIISIGKNLLIGGDLVWDELVYNCELTSQDYFNYTIRVLQSELRRILIKCVLVQNVIKNLIDGGAVVYAENIFGWTPLLHASALGSVDVVNILLKNRADPQSRTVLAHTSLHVAAMKGTFDVISPIIQGGLKPDEVDYFNRTALHVACMHGWSAVGMAESLGQKLPLNCPPRPVYRPPPKLLSYGGWLSSSLTLPKELTSERCDFDVLGTTDIQTFVFDYLALQRPVIIRNATSIHSMKRLHQLWQRNKFMHEYGALVFNEVKIPNFDPSTTKTSIKSFMEKMELFQEENRHLPIESIPHPNYTSEILPDDSPLLKEFMLPGVLDEELIRINPLKIQFYLGPPLSGTPVHFQKNTWNILIYGQKRWFLYPPNRAFYSKEHVWDWWKWSYRKSPDALECVQYPGDLVFVPDMWGHAEINLREGIGMASEFIYGSSEFSI